MSWHFSQALEAEFSAGNCLDGERFAPWNSPGNRVTIRFRDDFGKQWNRIFRQVVGN